MHTLLSWWKNVTVLRAVKTMEDQHHCFVTVNSWPVWLHLLPCELPKAVYTHWPLPKCTQMFFEMIKTTCWNFNFASECSDFELWLNFDKTLNVAWCLYLDFPTQLSLGLWSHKRENTEWQFSRWKYHVDARGQRRMARLVKAQRKATATQITTH